MEVSSRDDRIFKDERIVRGAVQFDLEDSASLGQRVPEGAMHLRDTAQAVRILNAAAFAVCSGNATSLQETNEMACAQHLARMRPSRMQTRVKGCGGSTQRFDAQSCRCLRGIKEIFQMFQLQTADR